MNKSRKSLLLVLFAVMAVFFTCFFVACEKKDNTTYYDVTWTVAEHITAKVENSETLPDKIAEGETLTFTLTAQAGYKVDTVKNNTTTLRADSKTGSYSVKEVTGNVAITVTEERVVKSIEITTNPTNMIYFDQDSLDTTGMVVTATFENGDKEAIKGYTPSPAVFSFGDETFKVSYKGVSSAEVKLPNPVVYKGVIDTDGGEVADEYLEAMNLKTNPYYSNVDGVVTFGFRTIPEGFVLPTASQVSKGEAGMFTFNNWSGWFAEAKNTTVKANWTPHVVTITNVELKNEEVDGKVVAFLIIKGKFEGAFNNVYVYLYEGNAKVSFKGETIQKAEGSDLFEAKVNLTAIQNKSEYVGKWMDIRVASDYNNAVVSNEVPLGVETQPIEYDAAAKIADGEYTYNYETWGPEGSNIKYLKLVMNTYTAASFYEISYEMALNEKDVTVGEGENAKTEKHAFATLTGTIVDKAGVTKFEGATILVSWWGANETEGSTAVIGDNGSFVLDIDLTNEFTANTKMYAHVTITAADGAVLYGDANTNLGVNSACKTELPALEQQVGDVLTGLTVTSTMNGTVYTYYVGAPYWDGLVGYVVEKTPYTLNYLGIEKADDKINLVLYAKLASDVSAEEVVSALKLTLDGECNKEDPYVKLYKDSAVNYDAETGLLTFKFDITDWEAGYFYLLHLNGSNLMLPLLPNLTTWNANGKAYQFNPNHEGWGLISITIADTTEPDSPALEVPDPSKEASWEMTSVALQVVEDKMYVVISGTYQNMTAEQMAATTFYYDWQGNPYAVTGSWNGNWERHCSDSGVLTAADGNWTFMWDVTSLDIFKYTGHFSTEKNPETGDNANEPKDFKFDGTVDTTPVVLGDKQYSLMNKVGSSDGAEFWGCVGLIVEAKPNPTDPVVLVTSAKLVEKDGAVYYVIGGTYENLTAEEMAAKTMQFDLQSNGNIGGNWEPVLENAGTLTAADGTWEYAVNVTELAFGGYITHYGIENKADFKPAEGVADLETSVTLKGKQYSLEQSGTYFDCVGVVVKDATAPEYKITSAKLVEKDGVAYYVFSGTYVNMTMEEAKATTPHFDVQANDNVAHQGWDTFLKDAGTYDVTADGWTYTVDLTTLAFGAYTTHISFGGENAGDFKPVAGVADLETTFTIGTKQYNLVQNGDFWSNIGLIVTEVEPQPQQEMLAQNYSFNAESLTAGDILEKTKLADGIYIMATGTTDESGKKLASVTVDSNSKTFVDTKITQRLKLNGTARVDANDGPVRCIEITVAKEATLTVYALSGSGTAARVLALYTLDNGAWAEEDMTQVADGKTPSILTYSLRAGETYYLGSAESGINIYGFNVELKEDNGTNDVDPTPAVPVIELAFEEIYGESYLHFTYTADIEIKSAKVNGVDSIFVEISGDGPMHLRINVGAAVTANTEYNFEFYNAEGVLVGTASYTTAA